MCEGREEVWQVVEEMCDESLGINKYWSGVSWVRYPDLPVATEAAIVTNDLATVRCV